MPRGIIQKLTRLPSPLPKTRMRHSSREDGYGVIEGDRREVFFLAAVVADERFAELTVGQTVEFEIEPGPLGRAARVVPLGEAPTPVLATASTAAVR